MSHGELPQCSTSVTLYILELALGRYRGQMLHSATRNMNRSEKRVNSRMLTV